MGIETFSNNAATNLDGSINNSVTSLTVNAHTPFPQSGQFRIRIEDECLLVTAGAGTLSWTVTRGVEGTAADSHADNATVRHVLTAGALAKFRSDNDAAGAIGSLPAAGRAGALYVPDSGSIILRDNGASWDAYGPISKMGTPPVASNWTWTNQGSATLTDSGGSLVLQTPFATGTNKRIVTITAPATPYTITAAFRVFAKRSGSGKTAFGLIFRQTSDGKLYPINYILGGSALPNIEIRTASGATDGSGSVIESATILDITGPVVWMRFTDNGTNRIMSMSIDGVNWTQFHSVGRTSYLTADQIGFWMDYDWASNPKMDAQLQLVSWVQS